MRVAHSTLPYPESGLDNVHLVNVPVWRCSNGHEEFEIPAPEELHAVLAEAILEKPRPLVGSEVRFLRKQLGLSSKDFASYLGVNPVSLSRIENAARSVTSTVDRLVRFLYVQLLAARDVHPCSRNMLPILESLSEGVMFAEDHRIEHVDISTLHATSQIEWRELRP
jgi:putative transcriptional regulator